MLSVMMMMILATKSRDLLPTYPCTALPTQAQREQ